MPADDRRLVHALAGAGFASRAGAPIVLTVGTDRLAATVAWLEADTETLARLIPLAGEAAIGEALI